MERVVRVVGMGSAHGDDRVGWSLVEGLAARSIAGASFTLRSDPLEVLEELDSVARLVVVVDAARSEGVPGTYRLLEWPDPAVRLSRGRSTHAFGLAEVMDLARALGRRLPRVVLVAVEAAADGGALGDLSASLRDAIPGLLESLEAWLREEIEKSIVAIKPSEAQVGCELM